MADEQGAGRDPLPNDVSAIMRAVRILDPTCSDEAIRRFWQEIAEAESALAEVELDDAVPVAAYTPAWKNESTR
ncbi:MAG: hypothetical protein ACRDJC_22670 [Thermomicrobiales bacterium]